jgi:cyclopropane-fatty-acyl-phospholipid synthase
MAEIESRVPDSDLVGYMSVTDERQVTAFQRSATGSQFSVATVDASSAAATVRPLIEALVGEVGVRVEFWDGSYLGSDAARGTLIVRSPDAMKRVLWAPGQLGLGRAFISGELDFDGDLFELLTALRPAGTRLGRELTVIPAAVRAACRLRLVGRPLRPPPEEARPRGRRHSRRRDASAIGHHYDVGNDFYRLVLGDTMTYSCARFVSHADSLEQAQTAKHELICRKLGLHEHAGTRLLDVGCGWGTLAMHAARNHNANVVGITISEQQADAARRGVHAAGLDDLVEIRLQDYRDLHDEQFDAISSVGMFEHVGQERIAEYFASLRALLGPRGRLLNHAISTVGGSRLGPRSFMYRYVFPDGELIDVGDVVLAMQDAGFEVRDVESLREHYAQTLRHWIANLQRHWTDALAVVGEARARIWLLYMAASALGFEDGGLNLHQTLGIIPGTDGTSGMPTTRRDWN